MCDRSSEMYFHAGYKEYVLFEKACTKSEGGFVGACLVVLVAGLLYELLKQLREELNLNQFSKIQAVFGASCSETPSAPSIAKQMMSRWHLLQTVLHMLQLLMSYCLMLIFMTYNVYLALCVLLGAGLGYFLVGWRKYSLLNVSGSRNEHCH